MLHFSQGFMEDISLLHLLKKREIGRKSDITQNYLTSKLYFFNISDRYFRNPFKCPINKLALEKQEHRYILTGFHNGKIAIFDTQIQRSIKKIDAVAVCENDRIIHQGDVVDALWYPKDTGLFMSLGADKKVKIWDTNKLVVADEYNFSFPINSFSISEKAKKHSLIAVGSTDATVYLCDLKTGSKSHVLKEHSKSVCCVKWSPRSENILFSGCSGGYIKAWDVRKTRSALQTLVLRNSDNDLPNSKGCSHNGAVTGLEFTPEGYKLLSFGKDNKLILWDLWTGENICNNFDAIKNTSHQTTVQFAVESISSSSQLAFIPSGVSVKILNILNGRFYDDLIGHFSNVNGCVYDINTHILYSCGNDHQIIVWDVWNHHAENASAYTDNWSDEEMLPYWRELVSND